MTRRYPQRSNVPPGPPADPFNAAMAADNQGLADELAAILEATKDFDQGQVKGILYQKPANGQGPFKWIDDIFPPFDLSAVFSDLKERFGGGDFELRIYAGGRIRKNVNIAIAKERDRAPPAAAPAGGMSEIFALMLNQAAESRRDQAAAAERQMSMFVAMQDSQSKLLAAVLPAMAGGGGGKASETVALITALQDRREGGGIKETIEAMAAFRTLMEPVGGDQGGRPDAFDPDDLLGSGARLVGPAVKALADYVTRLRPADAANPAGLAPDQLAGPPPAGAPPGLALGPAPSRFRILDLVRVDVIYCYQRGHDPEKAAELVYDVILANQVSDAELDELAAAFAFSPAGLDDLAAEGIDLRQRPEWAREFFAALVAIHSGEANDSDGGEGGASDLAGDGAPRPQGPGRSEDTELRR